MEEQQRKGRVEQVKNLTMTKIGSGILKQIYKKRRDEVRKYDYGLLLVIGGGEFYSGSPALTAMAAFRAGVDMVQIIAPKRAADIIASFSPNLATYPLRGSILSKEHLPILLSMTTAAQQVSQGKTAVVIGGGLGRSEEVKETVREYLSQINIPAIIDADAVHAIGKNQQCVKGKNFLFTPHVFEFFVLTGRDIRNFTFEQKMEVVREESEKLGGTVLLKGKTDIISNGSITYINETGSPYLTKGGTGDTLAGICGGLVAQGVEPFLAAQAAAYINGKAGEIAAQNLKQSLLATDLITAIPNVLKKT